MFINTKDGYIETRIYQSIYHGPLNFDITGLYCNKLSWAGCVALCYGEKSKLSNVELG